MKSSSLKHISVEQLIGRLVDIGLAQDDAILFDDIRKFNNLFRRETAILEALKERPGDQRRALLQLYDHPNIQVRLNAAKATLAVAPEVARRALEEIATRKDVPQGLDAGMSLRHLDRGVFKPT